MKRPTLKAWVQFSTTYTPVLYFPSKLPLAYYIAHKICLNKSALGSILGSQYPRLLLIPKTRISTKS